MHFYYQINYKEEFKNLAFIFVSTYFIIKDLFTKKDPT